MGRHEAPHPHHVIPARTSPRARRTALVAVAVLVVAALAAVPIALLRQEPDVAPVSAAGLACSDRPQVSIVAAEQIAPVVRAAAERAAEGACASYDVQAVAPAAAVATILSGTAPDAWVPDSSLWADQLNSAGPAQAWVVSRSLASSPVVIAVPPALAGKLGGGSPSWSQLLSGTVPAQIADPDRDAAGRLALFAGTAALGETPTARKLAGGAMIRLSRTAAPSVAELFERYAAKPAAAAAFPASEQAVAAHNREHPDAALGAVVPAEGTAWLDYPWIPAPGLSGEQLALTDAVLEELTGAGGSAELRAAAFRDPEGREAPGVPGMPDGPVRQTPELSAQARATTLGLWASVRTEMRMIAVIDVSGSMAWRAGPRTRIELAHGAAKTALATFPPASQVGLWEFSTDRGGKGRDWRQLEPIRPLSEKVRGRTQRQVLDERFAALVDGVGGDTGLHDSLLAAYREVKKTFDPDYVNSVVLLTDGINDDPSGLTQPQLLAALEKERDPTRPIRVILVGMGPEADAAALATIARAAGGASFVARDPQDITTVFVQALLSRG